MSKPPPLPDRGPSPDSAVTSAGLHWSPLSLASTSKGVRAHERVIAQIEQQIFTGRLGPGDRLPTQRELAELLGVGRPAVREALRILEYLGVVGSQTGRGHSSGSVLVVRPAPALTRSLRLHMAMSQFERDDLLETRLHLEVLAVAKAAEKAAPEDLDSLAQLVAAMEDPAHTPEQFYAFDTQFHVGLATASGNRLIGSLMEAIRDVVQHEMSAAPIDLQSWPRTAGWLGAEHSQILDATRRGDSDRAAELLAEHIGRFYDVSFEESPARLISSWSAAGQTCR